MKVIVSLLLIYVLCLSLGCKSGHSNSDIISLDSLPPRDIAKANQLNNQAIEHIKNNEWVEAQDKLIRALEADVTCGPAHNNLGHVYFQQKLYYKAAWEYSYAIKLMRNNAEPHYNLGMVLEEVGKYDQAVKSYEKAKTILPSNHEIVGNLIRARIQRGDHKKDLLLLIDELLMIETRREWLAWAKELKALNH